MTLRGLFHYFWHLRTFALILNFKEKKLNRHWQFTSFTCPFTVISSSNSQSVEKLIFFDVEQKWKLFLSLAPSLLSSRRMVLNTDGCECNKLTQSSRKSSIKGEVFTALKFLKELYDVNLIEAEHLKRLFFWSFRHHFFIMLWKRKIFPRAVGICEHCLYLAWHTRHGWMSSNSAECH